MKKTTQKKLSAFIIAAMIFSAIPALVNAQKDDKRRPRPRICNCLKRPIPPRCGQYCGWLMETRSISGTNSSVVQFELSESQNVSIKIYDVTGRLIRTLFYDRNILGVGGRRIEWDRKDAQGIGVSAGTYILQLSAENYTETKKLSLVK